MAVLLRAYAKCIAGQDAADALQAVIDLRRGAPERPFTDPRTGEQIVYLFMSHGKLMSLFYLRRSPSGTRPPRTCTSTRPAGTSTPQSETRVRIDRASAP